MKTSPAFLALLFATVGVGPLVYADDAIDAAAHGCRADYEQITVAVTATGQAHRNGPAPATKFKPSDIGKILIIDATRDWAAYSPDPTPLNARIASVDEQGAATLADIDEGRRGPIVANPTAAAELFTDNTDAIAAALHEQVARKASHVALPAGVIGLCPLASKTWHAQPLLDSYQQVRVVFTMTDGAALVGQGRQQTKLKLAYFGDFEPYKDEATPRFHCSPRLFLFEPRENQTTRCLLEGFSVEFPASPVVMSGYTLATDTWNTAPPRHAIEATLRDIAVIDPRKNSRILDSSFGGIYDAQGSATAESIYRFERCDFETGGGCSIKNQNELAATQRGGKRVYLNDVVFRGGGNIVTRHYLDSAKLVREGEQTFLEVEAPNFSWHDFNAHSDQGEGPYQPWCRVRKAYCGTIQKAETLPDGNVEMTFDTPAPITKAACTLLISFGERDKQLFAPDMASIEAGSPILKMRLGHYTPAAGVETLVGAKARIYYEENLLHCIRDGISPRRIKVDPATASNLTLLGQANLDLTVNTPDRVAGAFGHTFYVGANVSFFVDKMQIHDCAKRSFRVSGGGSMAAAGAHELTGYEVFPARGMAAMSNNTTLFQAAEEFSGPLKLRRSKASSVYAVALDMDDHSEYTAQGGIVGPSIIRNSVVEGSVGGGGPVVIEDSQVGLQLTRFDDQGNRAPGSVLDRTTADVQLKNCRGEVSLQNGSLTADRCELTLAFYGESLQYDLWKNALRGRFIDCRFTGQVKGMHVLSAPQRADFVSRLRVERSNSPGAEKAASELPLPPATNQ